MSWEREVIGDCTLYRGDARDIVPTLGGVDAVITDPPYGLELQVKKNRYGTKGYVSPATTVYADDLAQIRRLIADVMPLLRRHSTRMAVFPGPRLLFEYPRPDSLGGIYVSNGAGHDPWGFAGVHPILYYGKCPYGARRPNSFAHNQPGERDIDHPCPKPLAWMLWLVNRASLPGEVVLDPFMGSGTTGVACVQLQRSFIGIEIDPRYFDVACRRLEETTRQLFLIPTVPMVQRPRQEVLL